MTRKMLFFGCFFALFGLFSSTAFAQTSMQRQQQQQEQQETTETDSGTHATTHSTTQERRSREHAEPEVIRAESATDGIFQGYQAHKPGLRLDVGFRGSNQPAIWGIGVGYMFVVGTEIVVLQEVVGALRAGVGPDITLAVSGDGVHGVNAYGKLRLHAVSNGYGGIGIEGGAGTAFSFQGLVPGLRVGVYYSGRVWEIGYFYQHDIFNNRVFWTPAHNLGIRLHIPLIRY